MDKKILQHPTVQSHSDLKEICKPLEKLGIDFYSHVRVDKKNRFAGISSNCDYHFHYYKNNYYKCDIHMANNDDLGDLIVWDFVKANGSSEEMRREAIAFGASHLFTMVNKHPEFTDYFYFASSHSDETINQVYISQREWLSQFNAYFIDKMHSDKSLSAAWDTTFSVEDNQSKFSINANLLTNNNDNKANLTPQKLFLTFNNRYFHLTQKEYNVLHWLSLGKTAEDISLICQVSPSTVRKHIENIKNKSGCYSLFQLGQLFAQL